MSKNIYEDYFSKFAEEWVEQAHVSKGDNYPVGFHRNRIVKKILKNNKANGSVLDLACGGGNLCSALIKDGFDVTGIDSSREMIKIATEFTKKYKNKPSFMQGDVTNLNLKKKFDIITAMGIIGYLENPNVLLDTVFKHLKPGGIFILSTRNKLFNYFPTSLYNAKEENQQEIRLMYEEMKTLCKPILKKNLLELIHAFKDISLPKSSNYLNAIKEPVQQRQKQITFHESIKQHSPKEIRTIGEENNFQFVSQHGVHPHMLPPLLNNMLPPGLFNEISSSLDCLEDLEVSLIWSSVIMTVFRKVKKPLT